MTARRQVCIDRGTYATLIDSLAARGQGRRESGAFLLAPADGNPSASRVTITGIAFYDDLDPGSLTGNITFSADGYSALAQRCRTENVQVAADIHTHPGPHVRQSRIDATHPMVALVGHVALIAPHYAMRRPTPEDLGAHVYLGNGEWNSYVTGDATQVLRVTGRRPDGHELTSRLAHRFRSLIEPWGRASRSKP